MHTTTARFRVVRATGLIVGACVLLSASGIHAQISPEEHAKHHPGAAAGTPGSSPAPGGMGGMMGGGMGGMMDGMMEKMGAPKPRDLYPTLMNLPELTPEKREEISQQARERMQTGTRLISESLDALSAATAEDDFKTMQEATARLREGLARFDSGVAAERALAEGKAPRDIALQWFQRQMNLVPAANERRRLELWGMSPFHTAVMAGLVIFAGAMIVMYFFKMQRAANLLQSLTGEAAVPAAAKAPAAEPEARAATATASPKPKKWSGNLRVAQIFDETPTVKTFRLMNPLGGALPFTFLPGQFLTVRIVENGKPVKRSYTIASSPTKADYVEITVKHAPGGDVSAFLHTQVKAGDLLEFSGPTGAFVFTGRECKCILLVGGGVGITPLMSVLRYLTDRSWAGEIFLLYSIGTPDEFIFHEELDYLQRRHPNVRVFVTVSKPEGTDWKGHTGRITPEMFRESVPDLASRYVHICGPVPMMEAAKKMLIDLGVPPERVKMEAFGPALGKPEPKKQATAPKPTASADEKSLPVVTFTTSDKSAPLPPDQTILDVADEAGVEIDNSCRVGTCGTCRVKLLSGKVTMEVEDGLEPGDKEAGIVLACQAKATANVSIEA